jgi:hypothetical protein
MKIQRVSIKISNLQRTGGWHAACFVSIEDIIHMGATEMSQSITSKLAAVAIAVVMNGIILGGVCYLFVLQSDAAPTSAQCQYETTYVQTAIV